jgi:hypothetical protein
VSTEEWVDDDHLRALGRVVVAAAWLETVLDHIVRQLVDDGPVYAELIAGQSVSNLCQYARSLARHVIADPKVLQAIDAWTGTVTVLQAERNQLVHASAHTSDNWDPETRALVVSFRSKKSKPAIDKAVVVEDLLDLASRLDGASTAGISLMSDVVTAQVTRGQR